MSEQRFARVKAIVLAARERSGEGRAAYLDQACAGDAALRSEVESLLAHEATPAAIVRSGSLARELDRAVESGLPGAGTRRAPERVGPYRVLETLGEGGMGEVFRAEQDEPMPRVVALKLIRGGRDSHEFVLRFEAERRILARLEHPGIARLIDGGVTPDDLPWFSMEFVDGMPIDRYCDEHALGIPARIRLVRQVCAAVQYAHRNLIVHRDLKPGNILVTSEGVVKLLDFGIAKVLGDGDRTSRGNELPLTRTDSRLLTPAYAAPEQVRNEPVTTATDVYSLGVILYELLCGRRPYESRGGSTHELESAILTENPPAPSATLRDPGVRTDADEGARRPEGLAAARGTVPGRLRRALEGDLDNICLKALRKEPARRYSSVDELDADLRRHLEGRPVLARGDTPGYRAAKFVQRHRAGVAAAIAALVLLVSIVSVYTVRLREQRDRATQARDASEAVTEFLSDMLRAPDPRVRGRDVTALAVLDSASGRIGRDFASKPEIAARLELAVGRAYYGLGQYRQAREHMERAVDIAGSRLGRDATELRSARQYLAMLAVDQGRYQEAESLTTLNLAARRRMLGPEDPKTLQSVNTLADIRARLGHQAEAESLLLWNLAARRRVLGGEHYQTLNTMSLLANLYADQHRSGEAESLYVRELEIQRRSLGPENPQTLATMNNLALLYMQTARYAQAEPLFLETMAVKRRVLGEGHPDLLRTMYNLGILYSEQGRFTESESLLTRVLVAFRESFGEESPHTLVIQNNLARLYAKAKRYDEAEALFRSTLAARRRVQGAEHPATLGTQVNLANALADAGRRTEAEALYRQALATQRRVLGPHHANTLNTSYRLGLLCLDTDELGQAQALLDSAATGVGATLGHEHVDWARYATALGRCLIRLGRFDEAAALLDSAQASAARTRPPGDPLLRETATALAALHETASTRHPESN